MSFELGTRKPGLRLSGDPELCGSKALAHILTGIQQRLKGTFRIPGFHLALIPLFYPNNSTWKEESSDFQML